MYEMGRRNAVAAADASTDHSVMDRFSDLAPEEIAGAILLVLAIAFVAIRPAAVTRLFESPYATPAPGGGPGRLFFPSESATPAGASDGVSTGTAIHVVPLPPASLLPGIGPVRIARVTPTPRPTPVP